MITDVAEYFTRGCGRCARFGTPDCAAQVWAAGLSALRAICVDAGLSETVKWGQPCYTHAGRNIAIIGASRADFRLGFFDAALLSDPMGILERQGPHTRHPNVIRFADDAGPAALLAPIGAILTEAMGHAAAGRRAPRDTNAPDLPDDLRDALDGDPDLAEAFQSLTPGRQRSYVIALSSAKAADTRLRRIAGFRDRIIAGKGATER